MALMRGSQSTPINVADQASRRTASSLTTAPEGAKPSGTAGLGSAASIGWSGHSMSAAAVAKPSHLPPVIGYSSWSQGVVASLPH